MQPPVTQTVSHHYQGGDKTNKAPDDSSKSSNTAPSQALHGRTTLEDGSEDGEIALTPPLSTHSPSTAKDVESPFRKRTGAVGNCIFDILTCGCCPCCENYKSQHQPTEPVTKVRTCLCVRIHLLISTAECFDHTPLL